MEKNWHTVGKLHRVNGPVFEDDGTPGALERHRALCQKEKEDDLLFAEMMANAQWEDEYMDGEWYKVRTLSNGEVSWYKCKDEMLHIRINADGRKSWYLHGERYTEEEYSAEMKFRSIVNDSLNGQEKEIDGLVYGLTLIVPGRKRSWDDDY